MHPPWSTGYENLHVKKQFWSEKGFLPHFQLFISPPINTFFHHHDCARSFLGPLGPLVTAMYESK